MKNVVHVVRFAVIGLAAAVSSAQQPAASSFNYETLRAQIELAPNLQEMALSPEQLTQLQKIAGQVSAAKQELKKFRERSDVRDALGRARDALLAGKAYDEAWEPFEKFAEEDDQRKSDLDEAVEQGAGDALAVLKTAQLPWLFLSQLDSPADILGKIGNYRENQTAAWQKWRDRICRRLALKAAGSGRDKEPPAETLHALTAFFDRVHSLNEDEFDEKEGALTAELRKILLTAIGTDFSPPRREKAKDVLSDWLTVEGFDQILPRLAASTNQK